MNAIRRSAALSPCRQVVQASLSEGYLGSIACLLDARAAPGTDVTARRATKVDDIDFKPRAIHRAEGKCSGFSDQGS